MAKTFDSLVNDVVRTRVPHRLLCVFLDAGTKPLAPPFTANGPDLQRSGAPSFRVCSHTHLAVTPGLTFDVLVETAERTAGRWSTVVVAACHSSDRSMPTEQTADLYLANMRRRILAGDRTSLVEFDRQGNRVTGRETVTVMDG